MNAKKPLTHKPLRCRVVSDKMDKSRVGVIPRLVKHPLVGKYLRRSTRIMFHDEENTTRMGDEVLIVPTRPMSARKSFKLHSVVTRSNR